MVPSGEKSTDKTKAPELADSSSLRDVASQTLIGPPIKDGLWPPATILVPSGEKPTLFTLAISASTEAGVPLRSDSQTLIMPFECPETILVPSGEEKLIESVSPASALIEMTS